jgi:Na+/H+ antiporter NhaD/arsenite permease-like protein
MLLGAAAVLVTRQITALKALQSISLDVMLFLFGVFIIGRALEDSGYLAHISYRIFRRAGSLDHLVLFILFEMGIFSAFLMNDTLAIIGTPLVLLFARRNGIHAKVLLLALAFAVTIGSAMSPIGNPQNLLIAVHGNVGNPFITFFRYLFLPTIVNLLVAYGLLRLFYRKHFQHKLLSYEPEPIKDQKLARLSAISLLLLITLVIVKVVTVFALPQVDFKLTYIALIAALPIVFFSSNRLTIIQRIDWSTLIFFASMFILMQSVWDSGMFQSIITRMHLNLASLGVIMSISVLLSQLISNVPLVALYLPTLMQLGGSVKEMVALAAGSTIAGNFSILGAASNVIIIQHAESDGKETLTFLDFVRIGVPLTLANIAIYWVFISFV